MDFLFIGLCISNILFILAWRESQKSVAALRRHLIIEQAARRSERVKHYAAEE